MNPSLEVTVQVFIQVQFWRIGGQVEHLDLVLVLGKPGFDHLGMMASQFIENSNLALVSDRRNQVNGLTLGIEPENGRFTRGCIAPDMLLSLLSPVSSPQSISVFSALARA